MQVHEHRFSIFDFTLHEPEGFQRVSLRRHKVEDFPLIGLQPYGTVSQLGVELPPRNPAVVCSDSRQLQEGSHSQRPRLDAMCSSRGADERQKTLVSLPAGLESEVDSARIRPSRYRRPSRERMHSVAPFLGIETNPER